MSTALVGLLLLQFYWISNVNQLHKERFKTDASKALHRVVYELENYEQNLIYKSIAKSNSKNKALSKNYGFKSLLDKEQMVSIKDTTIHSNLDYLVVSGVSVDSLTGIKSEHRVITQNYGHMFHQDLEHHLKPAVDSSINSKTSVSHLFEKGLLEKSRYLNQVMLKMFSTNLFNDIKARLNPFVLDSLLHQEFRTFSLDTVYQFRIVDCENKTVDFVKEPHTYQKTLQQPEFRYQLFPTDIASDKYYIELDFPNKKYYFFKQMLGTLVAALILVLLVLLSFYFAVSTIFKQKRLSEIKNDFISNMTHELKTPISTISLACEAIKDPDVKTNTSTLDTFVGMIGSENKRLGLLVEKVLQTSLLEKGKLTLNKSVYKIDDLVTDSVNSFRIQFQQRGGDLRIIQLDKIEWEVDKIHFSNVLYNLMDNALKYSKDKPVSTVELIKEKNGFSFLISDNGIGIKKEEQKFIFDKLYRVSTGDVHNVKGFGLGLDYVKRIVEMHQGTISVKSEFNKGTTFKIRFKNE